MSPTIPMQCYYDLLNDVLVNGVDSPDRTGTGTRSVFGRQLRFDLTQGFPLLPGKFTSFHLIKAELLWMLSGSTNNEDLRKLNGNDKSTIWEEWSGSNGSLGPIYGEQWRSFGGYIDQVADLITGLRFYQHSRRHILSAWDPMCIPENGFTPQENVEAGYMSLAPCHYTCQFELQNQVLSCLVNLRSSDLFLGLPFNIAQYALFTHMLAHIIGAQVGDLIVSIGNAHIYDNHREQVNELLSRDHSKHELPVLIIKRPVTDIDDYKMEDLEVINYHYYPTIKAPVAI